MYQHHIESLEIMKRYFAEREEVIALIGCLWLKNRENGKLHKNMSLGI